MTWEAKTEERNICVVIPTYNNAGTLADVLRRTLKYMKHVIVVNDGSTDSTSQILEDEEFKDIEIVSYEKNQGKGHALKQGFKRAKQLGYFMAVTLDSDGQHYPEDIHVLVEALPYDYDAFVVGIRNFNNENMPNQNLFANKFSNFWFRLQTGVNLPDTQCGFRLYPLKKIRMWWPITSRYESELEFLVFSSWSGTQIIPVEVNVYYPPKEERISHFKPFYDFFRISVLNTILTILSIVFVPARFFRWILKKIRHHNK